MRGPLRRLVSWILLGVTLFACPRAWAGPRSAPTRSNSGSTVTLRGLDYLSVAELARRFDLKSTWLSPGKRVVLAKPGVRLELEVDAREAELNGLRILMGDAARMYRRSLYVSRIDAEHFLGPIIEPGYGRAPKPAVKVIALDAGHGGRDKGKINEKLKVDEKTFTLDVVVRLKKLLEAGGYRVVLTRTDDRYVELDDRAVAAQKAGADVFISVHFNSVPARGATVTGLEVFSMTPQYQFSTDDSGRDATADARVFNPGNTNDSWNSLLGYHLQKSLLSELKTPDRGHKRARFKVLRLATCPAVLVEAGYLSHDAEARKISAPAYRQDIAEAIAHGIAKYTAAVAGARS